MSRAAATCLVAVTILFCLSSITFVQASYYARTTTYAKHVVLRCVNMDSQAVRVVMNVAGIDVWRVDPDVRTVDMKMDRRFAKIVRRYFPNQCYLLIANVERHVQNSEKHMLSYWQKLKAWQIQNGLEVSIQDVDDPASQYWFNEYHDYNSIIGWYDHLANEYPNLVKYETIGQTSENRNMIGVRITASTNPNRRKFYMQCLIHAREWISGAICMYQADMLVKGYNKDAEITELLNKMEFVIVPIVNPDGYQYTWSGNRLWRKNRVVNSGSNCRGVDLNRNFNNGWGVGDGSSSRECSETYRGKYAASELEVQHVKKFFKRSGPIVAAIDFHSFGELILRPYGWNGNNSDDEAVLERLGNGMAKKMAIKYTSEKAIDLYEADGIACDWFYSADAGSTSRGLRPAAFTIELRDKGSNGFILPTSQILPTAKEVKRAVIYLAKHTVEAPLEYK